MCIRDRCCGQGIAPDYLFLGTGTGGTLAGLAAGRKLMGGPEIVAVNVSPKDEGYPCLLYTSISKAMLQTPAVGDRLYKQIPKVVSSLSEIAPKLQEVFDITMLFLHVMSN